MVPNQELRAVGAANAIASAFGCFVAMAGLSRSAVNVDVGAKSTVSLFVSALTCIAVVLLASPAIFFLPKATLSAIVFIAVIKLVDVAGAKMLWRTNKWVEGARGW